MTIKKIVLPSPVEPVAWEVADAAAFQAMAEGKATKEQQQRALNWLMYQATAFYELDYRQDTRDHAVMAGRRFVGCQIMKLLKVNTSLFKQK